MRERVSSIRLELPVSWVTVYVSDLYIWLWWISFLRFLVEFSDAKKFIEQTHLIARNNDKILPFDGWNQGMTAALF